MRFLLFLVSVALSDAASITGKVVGVHDGDTVTVLTAAKESFKVRLYGIDAPESKQPFGQRAKQALSDLAFGKPVTVEVVSNDRYGRKVGRVFESGNDLNVQMVERGFAWWYRSYAKKDTKLQKAESEAREARRGLWIDKTPVPPWEWRRKPKPAAPMTAM